jgi:hypothetical protein
MAWMLGIPVLLASTLGVTAIQPTIEDETASGDAETTDMVASADAEADNGGEADSGWQAASLESEATTDEGFESDTEAETSPTASISASTATDDELAPIAAPAPPPSAGGIEGFDGRLGVGAIRTIAGLNGINIRYFLTDQFAIGGSAGVALFTYGENDPESTDAACPDPMCNLENRRTLAFMAFNIEGLYFLRLGREAGQLPFRADFGIGGRFGVMTSANADDVEDNLDDATELHIEIPLVFQLMFGNNFALSPELGVDFRIIPGSREDGDDNGGVYGSTLGGLGDNTTEGPGFGWDLTPGVGLFGGASMHYYF